MQTIKIEKPEKRIIDLTKLAQIQELSEEHSSQKSKSSQIVTIITPQDTPRTKTWLPRLGCIMNCIKRCFKSPKENQFKIDEQQMTKEVEKIKRKKSKTISLLPINSNPKLRTLVLDLDETLIYTSFKKRKQYDFSMEVNVKGQMEKVYVTKRFGLDIFLFEMSQLFEIVLFTAGMAEYTDSILKVIDLQKRISHVLYRQHCTVLNGSYFLKNLTNIGRNLKRTILVDVQLLISKDNSMAGILHPDIFYQIEAFHGDQHDRKLLRLIDFLKIMANEEDFSCLQQRKKAFEKAKPKISVQNKKGVVVEQSEGSSKVCFEGERSIQM